MTEEDRLYLKMKYGVLSGSGAIDLRPLPPAFLTEQNKFFPFTIGLLLFSSLNEELEFLEQLLEHDRRNNQ